MAFCLLDPAFGGLAEVDRWLDLIHSVRTVILICLRNHLPLVGIVFGCLGCLRRIPLINRICCQSVQNRAFRLEFSCGFVVLINLLLILLNTFYDLRFAIWLNSFSELIFPRCSEVSWIWIIGSSRRFEMSLFCLSVRFCRREAIRLADHFFYLVLDIFQPFSLISGSSRSRRCDRCTFILYIIIYYPLLKDLWRHLGFEWVISWGLTFFCFKSTFWLSSLCFPLLLPGCCSFEHGS